METVRPGTWLHDLIEVYNDLGGKAAYRDVFPRAKLRRQAAGRSWTPNADATIRRTVEDHAESSANFRGRSVFYSVNGHGKGVWGLMPEYMQSSEDQRQYHDSAYLEGLEGIIREQQYLARSRDPRLVENRKAYDDYTCQVCEFRLEVCTGKFVIDVHHLLPLGSISSAVVTSIDDLVCLCPNCHRIAHTGQDMPLTPNQIREQRNRI